MAEGPPAEPAHATQGGSEPPLHVAAKRDQAAEVRKLVEGRADVELREPGFGWGPLHIAAGSGACQAIYALLELSANVNAQAKDREMPLHLAAAEGHAEALLRLVTARAEVGCSNADGETPLHVAVQHVGGKPGLGHIAALLELRADPVQKDGNGHNAYDVAGLYTNQASELREVLGGAPPKHQDVEDPWPDGPSELKDGTDPLLVAESLKEIGNRRFRDGQYAEAVRLYFKGKLFLPTGPAAHEPVPEGDEHAAQQRACFIAISSNAAACKLKLGEHDACLRICDGVLKLDPHNVKAFYRQAQAHRAAGAVDKAEQALAQAAQLEPENKSVKQELADIQRQRREERSKEQRMAQKMFG